MTRSHSFPLLDELAHQLDELDRASLRRLRSRVDSVRMPCLHVRDREVLAFASNDYLGLSQHPALVEAAQQGAALWGVGAGASALVSGHFAVHEVLEARLARFVGCEAALSFSTGYLANIAVMPALVSRNDAIFADKLNHASLVDGALLSRATLHRYPHKNVEVLARMLENSAAPRKIIVTDGVFSMDGDVAPLPALLQLAEQHDAWLLVDDAHGFGVLGPQGRGSVAAAGLRSRRLIIMATLGKAAGVAGAFVAGCATLIDHLVQSARPYVFTTAAPPMLAHTLLTAMDLIEGGDALRAALNERIEQLRNALGASHWHLLDSQTAIQPVVVGANDQALALSRALFDNGIWVPAIRPPTVPKGTARLRISLSAAHTFEHIEALVAALNAAGRRQ